MKLRILSLAFRDLEAGRDFYEMQQEGLGAYFLDTLFSDIESLLLHAGVHIQTFGYYRALSKRFPYAIYTSSMATASKSGVCWIVGRIHAGPVGC